MARLPVAPAKTELESPFVFRTADREVYQSTLETGELWLRSSQYYQNLEDATRVDDLEGVNASSMRFPLRVKPEGGAEFNIVGSGFIGQQIVPHYLACFHGINVDDAQRDQFGGFTFGVVSFWRLAAEIAVQCSRQIPTTGYRAGPVKYQHTALMLTRSPVGGAAAKLSEDPPCFLNPIDTDVLRKRPVEPFTTQDEWRVAVFTSGFLGADPDAPLRVTVDPGNFFRYIEPGA